GQHQSGDGHAGGAQPHRQNDHRRRRKEQSGRDPRNRAGPHARPGERQRRLL
ncbi:MAG: hypothetical protein AVDCRST_MAG86-2138, partial [uncultured Truepera sp.]